MLRFRKFFVLIGFTLGICITSIIILCRHYYSNKSVHFSVDDVTHCLQNLTVDSAKYNSAFDEPFLATLKKMHRRTGAKFTLYIYEQQQEFNLGDLPTRYTHEFAENKDWLRFGFHAPFPQNTPDSTIFMSSYERVDSCIQYKLGNAITKTLRLDYFFATPSEVEALHKKGVATLLTADDTRTSYSLPQKENTYLIDNQNVTVGGEIFKDRYSYRGNESYHIHSKTC